jgi:hypothetical protein
MIFFIFTNRLIFIVNCFPETCVFSPSFKVVKLVISSSIVRIQALLNLATLNIRRERQNAKGKQ